MPFEICELSIGRPDSWIETQVESLNFRLEFERPDLSIPAVELPLRSGDRVLIENEFRNQKVTQRNFGVAIIEGCEGIAIVCLNWATFKVLPKKLS